MSLCPQYPMVGVDRSRVNDFVPGSQREVLTQLLALQEETGDPEYTQTKAMLQELLLDPGRVGSAVKEEQMEISEPLRESDLQLSDDDEDLEFYGIFAHDRRKVNRWNQRNKKGETPLHRACIRGKIDSVKNLLEMGHPLMKRDNSGWTPLHEAANHGHLDIVQLLLEKGANINDQGGHLCGGITPLHDALLNGRFYVAQLLILQGASVTLKNARGDTPLGSLREWLGTMELLNPETLKLYNETESLLMEAQASQEAAAPP
eukprot:XP_004920331.2 PREDICTED: tonsoku-like protein [Xenopus tropicalis]